MLQFTDFHLAEDDSEEEISSSKQQRCAKTNFLCRLQRQLPGTLYLQSSLKKRVDAELEHAICQASQDPNRYRHCSLHSYVLRVHRHSISAVLVHLAAGGAKGAAGRERGVKTAAGQGRPKKRKRVQELSSDEEEAGVWDCTYKHGISMTVYMTVAVFSPDTEGGSLVWSL